MRRIRSAPGFLLIAGEAGTVIAGTTGGGQGTALTGAVGTLAGFVVLGPAAVRPAGRGRPGRADRRSARRRREAGARQRAAQPAAHRAATASALMVGVAVAAMFTVIALGVFAAPPLQLVLFLVLGAVTDILAGIRPARRAARLNMIAAITAV
jgi:ABC-type antimicrobial peptide transport system permease subunit